MIEWELEGKKIERKGRKEERTNGRTDERTNGRTDERTNGRTDENGAWLNGCEEPLINATSVLISIFYLIKDK